MKIYICIAICSTILLSSFLYAAKPLDIDTLTLKGFIKTKASKEFVETNGWIIFTGLDAKSQIQITVANGANILVNDAKMIKQKGKVSGNINNFIIGTSASLMADTNDVVYAGNSKFLAKLKGFNFGNIIAKEMRMAYFNNFCGTLAGTNPKGIKIMTQDGGIVGTSNRFAKIGLPEIPTMVKMINLKKGGCIGYLDLMDASPSKPLKSKNKCRLRCCGPILYNPAVWGDLCPEPAPPWPEPLNLLSK